MHRVIRDHLEAVLAETDHPVSAAGGGPAKLHLEQCAECRGEIEAMREHARLLRGMRGPQMEPRAGFYARVMERIENQGPASIWYVFSESPFARRIAFASMALAMAIGVYLYSSAPQETLMAQPAAPFISTTLPGEDQPGLDLTQPGGPDRNAVLVNLVTYREQ